MKIKEGDMIVVIAGKDKGKTGKVLKVLKPKNNKNARVVVEKLNMRTKFRKKSQGPGEQIKLEGSMDISNVMLVDADSKKRTRVGYKMLDSGKKTRVSKKSNKEIK